MSMQETYDKVRTYYLYTELAIKHITKFKKAFNAFTKELEINDRFVYRKEYLELCKLQYGEIGVFYLRITGETCHSIELNTASHHLLGEKDNLTMDELIYVLINIRQFILDACVEVMKQETKNTDELIDYFKGHILDML